MNPSTATARTLLTTLLAHGVRDVVVAPGSRSAPLTYALAQLAEAGVMDVHVRVDERDAAFLALGIAKGLRVVGVERPVAVVTTSGSAVANLHPAVLEASYAHLPLVALTADRPARLRGTGANQTIDDQAGVLSDVRARLDVPTTGPASEAPAVARAVDVAVGAATGNPVRDSLGEVAGRGVAEAADAAEAPRTPGADAAAGAGAARGVVQGASAAFGGRALSGPVQLNVQFDVPLVPDAGDLETPTTGLTWWDGADRVAAARAAVRPTVPLAQDFAAVVVPALAGRGGAGRAVVLAGDQAGHTAGALMGLSLRYRVPVLAEPSSPLVGAQNAVAHHAQVLATEADLASEITDVVVLGKPTLFRPDAKLLAREDVRVHHVQDDLDLVDPRDLMTVAQVMPEPAPDADAWLERWQQAGARAAADRTDRERARSTETDADPAADEALARATARELLLGGGHLYVASSSAVRYLDEVYPEAHALAAAERTELATVHASRGLAGIDGLVSTAIGFAAGLRAAAGDDHAYVDGDGDAAGGPDQAAMAAAGIDGGAEQDAAPVRLLIGDLAMLHDVGGLLRGTGEALPHVQIFVLNDDGGRIFAGLEHGQDHLAPYFSRFFATPHGRHFDELARAYDWPYSRLRDADAVRAAVAAGTPGLHEIVLPPVV
ncbi:thiamine pyrophosphate-binding protein [Brevibacterium litoralis]|uniref:thiamine pyrophosphate-binding protein n=1 Tax=Brevibacterium litoralis TaxID=3138935 RepID=UPI0032ED057A